MAGEVLKKRREELGLDLREVAETLKISAEYLSSIENDDFDRLPVAVYTLGYVRCYANYLNLDAADIIAGFTSHLSSPKPSTIIPVSSSKRKVPGRRYAISLLFAALVVFIVYTYAVKDRTAGVLVRSASGPVEDKRPLSAPPVKAAPVPEKPLMEDNSLKTAPAVTGQLPDERKEHQLGVTARETVWIRVRLEDGRREEMILSPGVSKKWDFNGSVSLKLGNSGGVVLTLDGSDLGVPGKAGQVMDLVLPQARQQM